MEVVPAVFREFQHQEETRMIYEVTLAAPAINEIVVTSADSEAAAIELAVAIAIRSMLTDGTATATVVEAPPGATIRE